MRQSFLYGIFILLGLLYFINPSNAAKKAPQSMAPQTSATDEEDFFVGPNWSDKFDWNLLKAFKSQTNKNVIVSPVSLKIVLALLYGGSAAHTKEQLKRVLNFQEDPADTDLYYNSIVKSLKETHANFTVNLGTRIFMKLKPQQKFQSSAKANYDAEIDEIDFDNAELASKRINKWAEEITEGRIRKLVHADDLHDLVMVVANALYFKGAWQKPFPRSLSHPGQFYISSSNTINVDYMAISDYFYYIDSKELQARIVRVPYYGDHYVMYFMLPNYKNGLVNLLDSLRPDILRRSLNLTDLTYVDMVIPKFKFDFQSKMDGILSDLGLDSMFTSAASFPGIVRGETVKLAVSSIIQKAGIEINEEGTTAFAATDVQVVNKFGDLQGVFNATHPFLFFIEDRKTGTILFSGKVENPIQSDAMPLPSLNDRGPASAGTAPHVSNPLNVPSGTNSLGSNSVPISSQSPGYLDQYVPNHSTQRPGAGNRPIAQGPVYEQLPSFSNQQPQDGRKSNPFDFQILKKLDTNNDNVFLSPASIKATLSMILEGANGESSNQIKQLLRVNDVSEARQNIKDFLYSLKNSGRTNLQAGHGIFVSDYFQNDPTFSDYKKTITSEYAADVDRLDFTNQNEASRIINSWISKNTRGFISDVITPGNINQNAGLVLASALYFKGDWKYEFNPTLTQPRCFRPINKDCINVSMMQITETFNYDLNDDMDAHVVELPYSDDTYSMLLIVPREKRSTNIASLLSRTNLNKILEQMEPTEVILHLPQFDIDYSIDLKAVFATMGVRDIFTRNSNLSGITSGQPLSIDALIHRSRIEVGEKGTIAASATVASVVPLIGSSSPLVAADHPFGFLIYNKVKKYIIFEGVVNQPKEVHTGQNTANGAPNKPNAAGQQQHRQPQRPVQKGSGRTNPVYVVPSIQQIEQQSRVSNPAVRQQQENPTLRQQQGGNSFLIPQQEIPQRRPQEDGTSFYRQQQDNRASNPFLSQQEDGFN